MIKEIKDRVLNKIKSRTGQVMFLTVMVLGAVVASVTMIAGLLMSYQIRRSADVSHSVRAIMAADAGVECMLYKIFATEDSAQAAVDCNSEGGAGLNNGTKFAITTTETREIGGADFPVRFVATGSFRDSIRSVEISLNF